MFFPVYAIQKSQPCQKLDCIEQWGPFVDYQAVFLLHCFAGLIQMLTFSCEKKLDPILFDLVIVSYGQVKLGFHLLKQLQAANY